jgi:hypothetical protein
MSHPPEHPRNPASDLQYGECEAGDDQSTGHALRALLYTVGAASFLSLGHRPLALIPAAYFAFAALGKIGSIARVHRQRRQVV